MTRENATPLPFTQADWVEPHRAQRKAVLTGHPEVTRLFGPHPRTALWVFGLLALQLGLTALSTRLAWPLMVVLAYVVGAFVAHGLYVLVHDASHGLVFRGLVANRCMVIASNLMHVIPSGMSFRAYHLKHHQAQGSYALDADVPCDWEVKLFSRLPFGHFLWLCCYPFLMITRSERVARMSGVRVEAGWAIANWVAVLAVNALVFWAFGLPGLAYLLASFLFAFGPHPLGARWIQEHYVLRGAQETNSYYGPLNHIGFNVGHHNEHNDFPQVPWAFLPRIRALAPEVYGALFPVRSYVGLVLAFVGKRVALRDRIVREWAPRGPSPVAACTAPSLSSPADGEGSLT